MYEWHHYLYSVFGGDLILSLRLLKEVGMNKKIDYLWYCCFDFDTFSFFSFSNCPLWVWNCYGSAMQNWSNALWKKASFLSGCGTHLVMNEVKLVDSSHGDWQTDRVSLEKQRKDRNYIMVSLWTVSSSTDSPKSCNSGIKLTVFDFKIHVK